MQLDLLRKRIGSIDQKILQILKDRMCLSMEVGRLKKRLKLSVENDKREKELMKKVISLAKDLGLNQKFIENLYEIILKESKNIQK